MAVRTALRTLLAGHAGVCTADDLRGLGLSEPDIRQLVRDGVLHRIRRGVFVEGRTWREAKEWDQHALRARAVYRGVREQPRALSHHSALALSGIALFGVDHRVHLARTDGGRSRPDPLAPLHGGVPEAFLTRVEGCRVVAPAFACLQVAATFGVEAGLVSAESGLQLARFAAEDLVAAETALGPVPGKPRARRVLQLAGGLSDSAGETRCRWLFILLGLPTPRQQITILDPDGVFVGRVDFLFEKEKVVVEFDGMGKYADVKDIRAEKVREDRLRTLGYEVVRLTWADLENPQEVNHRIRAAMARSAERAAWAG
ncbi:type IV toxin-antitoxin system AbiEi family antitoxin domain-containing protein [Ornithinimicrobium panacihumi]|uniref:type IV toxin-antitoxin system AbiEi family antitoxin domain-containing protein n=1 Tax=Ornithinimicrobium panacihumi TaxID=2008449 RepID=UPI003F8C4690